MFVMFKQNPLPHHISRAIPSDGGDGVHYSAPATVDSVEMIGVFEAVDAERKSIVGRAHPREGLPPRFGAMASVGFSADFHAGQMGI